MKPTLDYITAADGTLLTVTTRDLAGAIRVDVFRKQITSGVWRNGIDDGAPIASAMFDASSHD